MAIDVITKIEINRPVAAVAQYAFEPTNDPLWIGGIKEANLLTERPISKGTQVRRLAKFMGKTMDYILEVTEYHENHLMEMQTVKGPFPMVITYQFDPFGETKTFAQIRVQGSPKGFYALWDFIMAPIVRHNIINDIKQLKMILEKEI
jgi:hypothetical protein